MTSSSNGQLTGSPTPQTQEEQALAAASRDVEETIGELIAHINASATPTDVANAIGAHTKSIINRATTESRARLNSLFSELKSMDDFLVTSDAQLKGAIDQHVQIANKATRGADLIGEMLHEWRTALSDKTRPQSQ